MLAPRLNGKHLCGGTSVNDPNGDGRESIEAEIAGDATAFSLNPKYLLDVPFTWSYLGIGYDGNFN
jgi:hypothetical protein